MIDTDEAAGVPAKPTHQELERAIASVPGVEEAHVTQIPDTGKSRLRIRLANGEDAPTVSWAIAATLRERFGIVLDPGAIRPRISTEPSQPPADAPAPDTTGETASATPPPEAPSATPGDVADPPREDRGIDAIPDDVGTVEHIDLGDESVVVIGDRILLSEAARAVLSEAIDAGDGVTTGPDTHAGEEHPGGPGPEAPPAPSGKRQTGRSLSVVTEGASVEGDAADHHDDDGHDDGQAEAAAGEAGPSDTEADATLEEPGRRRAWHVDEPVSAAQPSDDDTERGRTRAAIHHLNTCIDVSDVRVTATLRHGDRAATGETRSVPTRAGILRAVAEATVLALRQLTGDRLIVGVDSVTASVDGDPATATVLVGVVTEAGEETLVGAALVRHDPERAVMRATLDALNRRVEPWLEFDLAG